MTYKRKKKSQLYESAEGYNLYAEAYDASIGYLNSFEEGVIIKFLGDLKGKKVLDVGCGTGRLTRDLLNLGCSDLTGVDISEEMLKIARKKSAHVNFVLGNSEILPFEDETFDVVVASFLLVHLKYPDKAIAEIYRVLKDGGFLLITNINQRKAPKLKLKNGEEIIIKSFYHRPEDIRKTLEENFFHLEREEFLEEEGVWINQILKGRK